MTSTTQTADCSILHTMTVEQQICYVRALSETLILAGNLTPLINLEAHFDAEQLDQTRALAIDMVQVRNNINERMKAMRK